MKDKGTGQVIDLYTILENRNPDAFFVKETFANGNYIELFDRYPDVISYLLFIDKKEDYIDFLEQSKLNEESFLLAYAYQNGICEAFLINDEDAEDRIEQYRRMSAESEKKHVVLFDSTYDDGNYYVFEVSEKEFEDKWNIGTVNRIE